MPALPVLLPAIAAAIDTAIADAVGLARMRGGRLASIVIEAPVESGSGSVVSAAVLALGRNAIDGADVEIRQQAGDRVRLVAVEIVPLASTTRPS